MNKFRAHIEQRLLEIQAAEDSLPPHRVKKDKGFDLLSDKAFHLAALQVLQDYEDETAFALAASAKHQETV